MTLKYAGITPIDSFNGKFVKREDLAHWTSLDYPSGSKVRQYMNMAAPISRITVALDDDLIQPPCLVGCSANSAMQIYVAAAAKQLDTKGIIYVPKRKIKSDATLYAERLGAEINEVKPGYLSVIRKAARQRAIDLKHYVAWDRKAAIQDTIDQCTNLPDRVRRIIVPTGSGLTVAGVIIGMNRLLERTRKFDPYLKVIAVGTSPMSDAARILKLVKYFEPDCNLGLSRFITSATPYDTPVVESLPDGTPLDPFYAAKAWKYMQPGDLLWAPGLRPVESMPEVCRGAFKDWKGPI